MGYKNIDLVLNVNTTYTLHTKHEKKKLFVYHIVDPQREEDMVVKSLSKFLFDNK